MKLFYIIFFSFLFSFSINGQALSGKIIDDRYEAVIGAYIIHLNSAVHAFTNEFGLFNLQNVAIGDTLEIMHLGFENQQIIVNDFSDPLQIQLEKSIFQIEDIVVSQSTKATNILSFIDLKTNPVQSAQEILTNVPGLFIGQHAGGGKAEQIFLRGFDIDHGTDVQLTVDGLPVNMVSHAHGQGYADLHFLIPETIDFIDFGKGPYYTDKGNFATAGYVNLKTKDQLEQSIVGLEVGQFNTQRALGMFNLLPKRANHNAYIASEYLRSDGPFESPQDFHRFNIMGKYTGKLTEKDHFSFIGSHFTSQWNASGQIPIRAVQMGLISRFGAIDDTEGGTTSRSNFALNYNRFINDQTFIKNSVYYSMYDFQLFSNFTFFLNDPVNQDQIMQQEKRQLWGIESELNKTYYHNIASTHLRAGVGLRHDRIKDNELSNTLNRVTTLSQLQFGDVKETNLYTYLNAEIDFQQWLIQTGIRLDYFQFNYLDRLQEATSYQDQDKIRLSPKLNILYNYTPNLQFYLKSGIGFHSNDTRVIIQETADAILPAAYGADLGTIWKPNRRLMLDVAAWYLLSEQEFVYVGDAGIVEPSGASRRLGLDLGLRYQVSDFLFADANVNYAYARSVEEAEGENFIPLAPILTSTGGLSFQKEQFTASLRYRFMHDRPANEDYSIVADGYFVTDFNAVYEWKKLSLGISIDNLFNQAWNETQFATESRLSFEDNSVEEIHFTPGTPFFLKGKVLYRF